MVSRRGFVLASHCSKWVERVQMWVYKVPLCSELSSAYEASFPNVIDGYRQTDKAC